MSNFDQTAICHRGRPDKTRGVSGSRNAGKFRWALLTGALARHVTQSRKILRALLVEELQFQPEGSGCRFSGKASVGRILSGIAPFNGLGAGGGDRTRTGVSPHGILNRVVVVLPKLTET